jgi:hypothetical protein
MTREPTKDEILMDMAINGHEETIFVTTAMRRRIENLTERLNIEMERIGDEPYTYPDDLTIMLASAIDRGLTEMERDDGLWSTLDGRINPMPYPVAPPWRRRIARGWRAFVRELRNR